MDTATPDTEKMTSENNRLHKLQQQQEKIRLAIAREKSKLADQARRDDTRRKILIGATIMTEAEKDSALHNRLYTLLESTLVRPDDRALFGFASLSGNENGEALDIKKAESESA